MVEVGKRTLDLTGAQQRIREGFLLTRVRMRVVEMDLEFLKEVRRRIAGPSRMSAEDEQVTSLAAGRCVGYAASFFLRAAR
jgi:hypothetical protein